MQEDGGALYKTAVFVNGRDTVLYAVMSLPYDWPTKRGTSGGRAVQIPC